MIKKDSDKKEQYVCFDIFSSRNDDISHNENEIICCGSFNIKKSLLPEVSVSLICQYIIDHPIDFFHNTVIIKEIKLENKIDIMVNSTILVKFTWLYGVNVLCRWLTVSNIRILEL